MWTKSKKFLRSAHSESEHRARNDSYITHSRSTSWLEYVKFWGIFCFSIAGCYKDVLPLVYLIFL
jgi:hypothetical protein